MWDSLRESVEAEFKEYVEGGGTPYGVGLVLEDDVSDWLRPESPHPLLTLADLEVR